MQYDIYIYIYIYMALGTKGLTTLLHLGIQINVQVGVEIQFSSIQRTEHGECHHVTCRWDDRVACKRTFTNLTSALDGSV